MYETPCELRILQLTELELLLEIDRVCRLNNIKYSIIAGTLLGAVRHKGFIPWDDDLDVGMKRSQYEAFVDACKRDLDHLRYYFQDQFNTPGYRWGYGKLRRHGTKFVRPGTEHLPYEQGVYVDVFPLDQVPNGWIGQAICNFKCYYYRKVAWSVVGKNVEKNPVYRLMYSLLARIKPTTFNTKYAGFIENLHRVPAKYLRQAGWVTKTAKGYSGYWLYKTEWLDNLKEFDFEGYSVFGLADYDAQLRRNFGDYMTPVIYPPLTFTERILPPVAEINVHEHLKEQLDI